MKKTIIAVMAALTLFATGLVAHAQDVRGEQSAYLAPSQKTSSSDNYYSGSDADIIRRRNSGYQAKKYSASKIHNVTQNYRVLPDSTNWELYNYVKDELNPAGYTVRIWQPKSEVSIITDANDYSVDNGNKVYNFNSFGYQIPESTDFNSLTYIGYFQLQDGTIYRYWK